MQLTKRQIEQFDDQGFLFFPELFSEDEIAILRAHVERAQTTTGARSKRDRDGTSKAIALWTRPGDSAFDLLPRLPRIAEPARQLLRDDVYHWHSKLMFKSARTGGAWAWHQDYGYWFHDGCPTPNMLSVMIFLDEADLDNGCLQIMPGAHRLGRLEHEPVVAGTEGHQTGIAAARVRQLLREYDVCPVVGRPGGTLFWHSNLPHFSEANRSDHDRLAVIVALNAMTNEPGEGKGHGAPIPIEIVTDDALNDYRDRAAL